MFAVPFTRSEEQNEFRHRAFEELSVDEPEARGRETPSLLSRPILPPGFLNEGCIFINDGI